jgi:hypothetical protein
VRLAAFQGFHGSILLRRERQAMPRRGIDQIKIRNPGD